MIEQLVGTPGNVNFRQSWLRSSPPPASELPTQVDMVTLGGPAGAPPKVEVVAESSPGSGRKWLGAGLLVALAAAGAGLFSCTSMAPDVAQQTMPTQSQTETEALPVAEAEAPAPAVAKRAAQPAPKESSSHEAGRRLRETGHDIGHSFRNSDIADDFREAGREIGDSFREAGDQIREDSRELREQEWVKDAAETGREIGRQGKKFGGDVKDAAVDFWHGITGK